MIILLSIAVIMDFMYDKIFNEWILICAGAGLSFAVWHSGTYGVVSAAVSMIVPVIVLFPLFMIGGLGGGDIKLIASVGSFFSVRQVIICLVISFLAGAIMSLLRIAADKSVVPRIQYFVLYLRTVTQNHEWRIYDNGLPKGKIHFALPVFIGVVYVLAIG